MTQDASFHGESPKSESAASDVPEFRLIAQNVRLTSAFCIEKTESTTEFAELGGYLEGTDV